MDHDLLFSQAQQQDVGLEEEHPRLELVLLYGTWALQVVV